MGEVIVSQFLACLIPVLLILMGMLTMPYLILGLPFNGSLIVAYIVLVAYGIPGMLLGQYNTNTISLIFVNFLQHSHIHFIARHPYDEMKGLNQEHG